MDGNREFDQQYEHSGLLQIITSFYFAKQKPYKL